MATTEKNQPESAPKPSVEEYEVVGLKPYGKDSVYPEGSIPMKIAGEDVDLAKADQQYLKKLFDQGKRYVRKKAA